MGARDSWPAKVLAVSVCFLTLGMSLYRMFVTPVMTDDAFIGFRIAKNFALGNGLVFNAGERVMTSTTTLYPVLNGLFFKLFGDGAPTAILLLNTVWHSLAVGLLFLLVYRQLAGRSLVPGVACLCAVFAALFFSCASAVALIVTSGMETPFYTFFIVLAFYLYSAGKLNAAVAVATVSFLIRPEGFLVAAVIAPFILVTHRKVYLSHVAIIVGIVAPFLAVLLYWYLPGPFVPESIAAKALDYIDRREVITEFLKGYLFSPKRLPLGFLFFSGLYYVIKVDRRLLPLIIWGLLYAALFTLLASWWQWYKPPFYMVYSVVVALGLYFWADFLGTRIPQKTGVAVGAGLLAASLVLISCVDQSVRFRTQSPGFQRSQRTARRVAALIVQDADRSQTVMLEPLGCIGFYALDRKIWDYPGLCAPAVVVSLKKLGRKVAINLVDFEAVRILNQDIKPSLFVMREGEFRVNEQAGTIKNYRQVDYLPLAPDAPALPQNEDAEVFHLLRRID